MKSKVRNLWIMVWVAVIIGFIGWMKPNGSVVIANAGDVVKVNDYDEYVILDRALLIGEKYASGTKVEPTWVRVVTQIEGIMKDGKYYSRQDFDSRNVWDVKNPKVVSFAVR